MTRIERRFKSLRQKNQAGFIAFVTAGDPDLAVSSEILAGLPKAGVDLIEIGMPFSDPMADGPSIQQANKRAFKAGVTLEKTLQLVADFRKTDRETPIILMGYYNPVLSYGVDRFLTDAKSAGIDGLIVVDLPPEEDEELCRPATALGLNFIRLLTPTTDAERLPTLLKGASGFLYYVSVAGVTGVKSADQKQVNTALEEIRHQSSLPLAVGFGITTAGQAATVAQMADAAVVGSAIVNRIAGQLDEKGAAKPGLVGDVLSFVESLAAAVHHARQP